nr:MAG TPA: hypothetical protein [Caudoviricetes sp.]
MVNVPETCAPAKETLNTRLPGEPDNDFKVIPAILT